MTEASQATPDIDLRWDKSPHTARRAAEFAGRVIGAEPRYISHGEVQTGLSPDGTTWEVDLAARYQSDFLDLGDDRDLLVALASNGAILGILILAWEQTSRRRFAILEDMAVDPASRSSGIGEHLLAQAEAKVRERGVDWLFLESGIDNHGAHRFFERHGFRAMSHVFGKHLSG